MNNTNRGVSVILCCYNSAARLEKTLLALAHQRCSEHLRRELIIVDNASKDNTSAVAAEIWEKLNTPFQIKILYEPLPGLGFARKTGIAHASYSVILFCDDDNWLAVNYMQGIYDILENDTSIAACGGMGVPVFESAEPFWFYAYAEAFALGSQDINNEGERLLNLYGAGLAIQKAALEELYKSGFEPQLHGRTGKKLSSSEDTEITYAFVLMGYKLFCTDELKFFHYLPKERLTLDYLKKLYIAFGNDGPVRNLYYAYISNRPFHKQIKNWSFHFILSLFRLGKYFIIPPKKFGRFIYLNWNIAYIKQLISVRKEYSKKKEQIVQLKAADIYNTTKKNPRQENFTFETNGG
jgi:glycosyltransferase involved in cell wall biosynthesis